MKIKFNPDNELRLSKAIKIDKMTIVVRAIKYYPQRFLDECLYKI